jgi:hypothetical protein
MELNMSFQKYFNTTPLNEASLYDATLLFDIYVDDDQKLIDGKVPLKYAKQFKDRFGEIMRGVTPKKWGTDINGKKYMHCWGKSDLKGLLRLLKQYQLKGSYEMQLDGQSLNTVHAKNFKVKCDGSTLEPSEFIMKYEGHLQD